LVYLGGIRSGKSRLAQARFAEEISRRGLKSPVYLGTLLLDAADEDRELVERLSAHREARPGDWKTLDVGKDLLAAGESCLKGKHDAWLLDGLGAWAALQLDAPQAALAQWGAFLTLARQVPLCVLVLDEVGQGGVPAHLAARAFVDLNGSLNQAACAEAEELWWVLAGKALRVV
jgi:adenosyl cobinamide kinase/adenosyl cobinamide phosphate guanylyltransferase